MCEAAPIATLPDTANAAADLHRPQRRKLWELDRGLHCSIIGTCLTFEDLRKLARKLGVPEQTGDDYDLHVRFVRMARERVPGTRMMQKILERRHKAAIARFGEATDDATLEQVWSKALADGDIPGAYWAMQTHPALTPDLEYRAFGEVHMLSHIAGASNRADVKDLKVLREERAGMEATVAEEQALRYRQVSERDGRITDLEAQVRSLNGAWERVRELEGSLAEMVAGTEVRGLRISVRELQRELTECMDSHAALRLELRDRDRDIVKLNRENRRLRESLDAVELKSMKIGPRGSGAHEDAESADCSACCGEAGARCDLAGRCVLYVGGRPQHACRFRDVVERWNGTFIHHDGGREQSDESLEGVLTRADIVVFPTDCISHGAARKIKERCRSAEKAFVPVRTSGLGSFVSGLQQALTVSDAGRETADGAA